MNDIKISIIVPVYKVEKYIAKCIESLINQTLDQIEIILIDDESPDKSGKICDEYASKDSRIKVIHKKNEGVSVARNTGIEHSRGKWITFVDGDDWTDENLCLKACKFAEKNNADVLLFSYFSAYPTKNVRAKLIDLPENDVSDKKNYIQAKIISQYYDDKVFNNGVSAGTSWCKMVRRSVITENGLRFVKGLVRAQDTVFWLNTFKYVKKIAFMDEPLYYYRISDTSIVSGNKYIPDCDVLFGNLLSEYRKYIDDNGSDIELKKAYYSRCIQVLMWNLKHHIFNGSFPGTDRQRIRLFRDICGREEYADAIFRVNTGCLPKRLKLLVYCCRLRAYYLYYKIYTLHINKK